MADAPNVSDYKTNTFKTSRAARISNKIAVEIDCQTPHSFVGIYTSNVLFMCGIATRPNEFVGSVKTAGGAV